MKYFETEYSVYKPIDFVFDHVLDILWLQNEIEVFDEHEVTSDDLAIDQLGKRYTICVKREQCTLYTSLTLVEIDKPVCYVLDYSYQTKYSDGKVVDACDFLPWDSMRCIVSLKNAGERTLVTTTMYANGVKGIKNFLFTKLYGFINYFQQQKYNKKVARFLNVKTNL